MDWAKAISYWIAQLVGAAAAAYLLQWFVGPDSKLGSTIGSLTPHRRASRATPPKVIVLEGMLTFFLVVAVFASGVHGRNGNVAGIAIGLVLTMDILCRRRTDRRQHEPGPHLRPGAGHRRHVVRVDVFRGSAGRRSVAALLIRQIFLARRAEASG